MGTRALEFSKAHPDSDPGAMAAVVRLEQLVARANEVATAQRNGLIQVRAASAQKEDLRRQMLEVPITHLAEVGRAAAREEPGLGKSFRFRPEASTHFAFRTAARAMGVTAQEHREVLAKYGLSQPVLDEFVQQLDQLDEAVVLGYEGRAAHVGATRELRGLATEIFRAVRVMDGRNRQRFAQDGQLLGSWFSVSRVTGQPSRSDAESEGGLPPAGEEKPAA
jgi:hypothetical protein